MALEEIRDERIKKIEKLKEAGIDPYPAKTGRTHRIGDALKKFSSFERSRKKIFFAGRILAKREHGGSMFLDLYDETAKVQIYFKEDILGGQYALAFDTLDIGDFIGCEGKFFKTKRGELTLEVISWTMLAKSLRPLPEKWHGLQDVEERFRKRYLDLLMNDGMRARFEIRSRLISAFREFLDNADFLEVETPMLQSIAGGALAKPFVTHHNALDVDFYLRIAPELYLKRLLVGGFERVYEIGRNFRNEGIDVSHNPEFTMLECYSAYWDEEEMMDFVEDMFISLARAVGKKNGIEYGGEKISFGKKFKRISFRDILARYALVTDYEKETRESMVVHASRLGIEAGAHESKGKIADEIYKKICRPYMIQPTFIINHPLDISPLAKRRAGADDEVRRFQLIIGGLELANGFAELNDSLDQRARFETQERERAGGEDEAHQKDEDYLEALEYGMPPAAGLGVGVDRVAMLFTDTKNVREIVLFPTMRPKS